MESDSVRFELVEAVCGLIEHAKALGFPQTSEILLVALSILSNETPLYRQFLAGPLPTVRDDHENLDSDWPAKEAHYLQIISEAQILSGSSQ